jgi:hypothetical protein
LQNWHLYLRSGASDALREPGDAVGKTETAGILVIVVVGDVGWVDFGEAACHDGWSTSRQQQSIEVSRARSPVAKFAAMVEIDCPHCGFFSNAGLQISVFPSLYWYYTLVSFPTSSP